MKRSLIFLYMNKNNSFVQHDSRLSQLGFRVNDASANPSRANPPAFDAFHMLLTTQADA